MPVTSIDAEEKWDKWIKERDDEAANALIQMYLPLVTYHVQRISVGLPKNVSKEELISHGMLGLYDALQKFDDGRDLKFDTYASFRIRGAILDGLRKADWIPRGLRDKIKKIEATIETLEQKRMRHVTLDEVAEDCQMTIDDVTNAISESFLSNLLSIDHDRKDDYQEETGGLVIEDETSLKPDDHLIQEETYKELTQTIKHLNKKEQLVISLFYYEELTLTEIGQVLSLSTSRISQIHSKALFKLKLAFK